MSLVNQDFKFIRGDTFTKNFSIAKSDWLNITQIYYTVKTQQNGKVLLQKTLNNGITLVSEDDEKYYYNLTLDSKNTDNLKTNIRYVHDIEVISDSIKQTVLKGNLILDEEVTTYKNEE